MSTLPPPPYLRLENLHTYFTKRTGLFGGQKQILKAVNGVDLDIPRGQILGLVGESGCGKSTLARTIMQLTPPTLGQVILNEESLTGLRKCDVRKRRLDFQMIFQDPYASLNPRMTIYTTLAEAIQQRHPHVKGSDLLKSISQLMERVGLKSHNMRKYPHEFSGGQRQRIAIARALAPEPKFIIADEPVSALDVSIQSQILNLLLQLRDEMNLTMMFISHDLSVVRYLSDQIIVMFEGQIVERGEAEALFQHPQHPYTQRLLTAIPRIRTHATL